MNFHTLKGLNVVLHGIHYNGVGQGSNSDIEVINVFMENKK
jgi:hypothetical protein